MKAYRYYNGTYGLLNSDGSMVWARQNRTISRWDHGTVKRIFADNDNCQRYLSSPTPVLRLLLILGRLPE